MSEPRSARGYHSKRLQLLAEQTVSAPPGDGFEIPILLSALSVEAFVNELPDLARQFPKDHASAQMRGLAQVLGEAEAERASTELKIQLAHLVLTGRPLDKGAQPYQDVALLLDLRNRIVHSRAEAILMPGEGAPAPEKPLIVRRFVAMGVIAEPANPVSAWRPYLLVREVAQWSVDVTRRLFEWFAGLPTDLLLRGLLEFFVHPEAATLNAT